MTTDNLKKALGAKPGSGIIPRESLLSTGSTILNLGCSGRRQGGFAKGMYFYIVGDSSAGKAQPLSAKILTVTGWREMRDLKVGDCVIDPDGGNGTITGIFPQGRKKIFDVTLSDGAKTQSTKDHLWMTEMIPRGGRRNRKHVVRTLQEIQQTLWCESLNRRTSRHRTPPVVPPQFRKTHQLLDPYLLGVLLGNGGFTKKSVVSISSVETWIIKKISKLLPIHCHLSHREKGNYDICGLGRRHINPVLSAIRELGLSGLKSIEKFIPECYLFGSAADRTALLQGLMDTDGTVDKTHGVEYASSSPQLISDVRELAWSLGCTATLRCKKSPKYTYRGEVRYGQDSFTSALKIPKGIQPFTLPRKRRRYQPPSALHRSIFNVTPAGTAQTQCISVATKRGLYITDDYIVTHNTWLSLTTLAEAAINKNFDKYLLILDDVEGGAQMDLRKYFGKLADRISVRQSGTIEEFYDDLDDTLRGKLPCIYVLDSMDALSSESEEEKFQEQKTARRKGREITGSMSDGKAKQNSAKIRRSLIRLRETGSILIIISQTRDNIGFGAKFNPKTRSGGRALKFYAQLELWMSVKGKLKTTHKGKQRQTGITCQVQIKKNRLTGKDRTVEFPIYHSFGIDDVGGCIDYLVSEGHWKSKGGEIIAKEFKLRGSVDGLAKQIEAKGLQRGLRDLCGTVWKEIEDACNVARKARYV